MTQKQVAFIVIGDEILSGRTQDINVQVLAKRLNTIGARLAEVRMISDDEPTIVTTIQTLQKQYDFVISSGGIGPTHDDITADSVAKAFGVDINERADAREILATNYPNGEADLTPSRLRMARIPNGANLIKNPISKAPGFRIENLFVLAGVPKIFEAMLNDVMPQLGTGPMRISKSILLKLPESQIAIPLGDIARVHPNVSIGSYPQTVNEGHQTDIVVAGFDEDEIDEIITEVAKWA